MTDRDWRRDNGKPVRGAGTGGALALHRTNGPGAHAEDRHDRKADDVPGGRDHVLGETAGTCPGSGDTARRSEEAAECDPDRTGTAETGTDYQQSTT